MTWCCAPFNLYWASYCYVQQCGAIVCVRVCVSTCVHPTHVDSSSRAQHKHMCVAMEPTTTVTSKPICCVTMVTVISQRVGGKEREREREREKERGGIQRKRGRGWDILLLDCNALFPFLPPHCVYRKLPRLGVHVTRAALCHLLWTSCLTDIKTGHTHVQPTHT